MKHSINNKQTIAIPHLAPVQIKENKIKFIKIAHNIHPNFEIRIQTNFKNLRKHQTRTPYLQLRTQECSLHTC